MASIVASGYVQDVADADTGESDEGGVVYQRGDEGPEVQAIQDRLTELGYRPGAADGTYGAATASAVLAFQKAEGLQRDGQAGPAVVTRLDSPQATGPESDAAGPRVEVDLDRQIAFYIAGSAAVTTINISSGSGREYDKPDGGTAVAYTPTGDYAIERRVDGLREAPLGSLYYPLYFTGGWAIHGSSSVPAYPASHGCVRTANEDQDFLFAALADGDAIEIYGTSEGAPDDGEAGLSSAAAGCGRARVSRAALRPPTFPVRARQSRARTTEGAGTKPAPSGTPNEEAAGLRRPGWLAVRGASPRSVGVWRCRCWCCLLSPA